ncbi:hypothetical protein Hanom_Chr03g00220651 [Helianthus anomalus]
MSDELVVENGRIDLNFNQIYGDCGNFCDHDSPECVRHACVGFSELKFHVVVFELADFDLREPLGFENPDTEKG